MPTVNIPNGVRFALYLIASLALIFIGYFADLDQVGDAEVRLVTSLAAMANVLAASKVDLAPARQRRAARRAANVRSEQDFEASGIALEPAAAEHRRDERGAITLFEVAAVVVIIAAAIFIVGRI